MMRESSDDWLNETVQTSLHMPLVRMHVDFTRMSYKEGSKPLWQKESPSEKVGLLKGYIFIPFKYNNE